MKVVIVFAVLFGCALAGSFTQISVPRPYPGYKVGIPIIMDYNNDGLNDIILHTAGANDVGGQITCLYNSGNYTFLTSQLLYSYSDNYMQSLCIVDLDGDNDYDLVRSTIFNTTHTKIVALENRGGSYVSYDVSLVVAYFTLACVDINIDGRVDIMTSSTPIVAANLNQGCFRFNQLQVTADDSHPPAFVPGKIPSLGTYSNVVFIGSWSGYLGYVSFDGVALKATSIGGNYNTYAVDTADFNGDSVPDVIAGGMNCWNMNLYTDKNGVFTQGNLDYTVSCNNRVYVSAGDLDGNGYGDIVFAIENTMITRWNGPSGETFETIGSYSSPSIAYSYPIYKCARIYNNNAANSDIILNSANTIEIFTTCRTCSTCPANSYVDPTGACLPCAANYKSLAGSKSCTRVCSAGLAGTYPSCSECPAGSHSAAGAATCTQCAPNQVSAGGNVNCQSCPANTYPMAQSSCSACPLGTYAPAGALSCTTCPSGSVRGCSDSSCISCPAGTYASVYTCVACAAGTYASSPGSASCAKCPNGTFYGSTGAATCTSCPAGTSSSSSGVFCY